MNEDELNEISSSTSYPHFNIKTTPDQFRTELSNMLLELGYTTNTTNTTNTSIGMPASWSSYFKGSPITLNGTGTSTNITTADFKGITLEELHDQLKAVLGIVVMLLQDVSEIRKILEKK